MTDIVGYQPGDAWLISGPGAMVMTAGDAAVARRFWGLVRREASAEEIFDGTVPGPTAGDLALVIWDPAGVRVLVRGAAQVRITGPDSAARTITAAGLLTWREEVAAGPVDVEVALTQGLPAPASDDDLLPVPAGVVRAGYARRWAAEASPPSTPAAPTPEPSTPAPLTPAPSEDASPEDAQPEDAQPEDARSDDASPGVASQPSIVEPTLAAPAANSDSPEPAGPHPAGPEPAGLEAAGPEAAGPDATGTESPATHPDVDPSAGAEILPTHSDVDPTAVAEDEPPAVVPTVLPRVDPASRTEPDAITGDDAVTVISMVPVSGRPSPTPAPATPAAPDGDVVTDGPGAAPAARHRIPDVTQSVPLDYEDQAADPDHAAATGVVTAGVVTAGVVSTDVPEPVHDVPDLLPGPPAPQATSASGPGPILGDHDGITELSENLPAGFTPPPLPPPLAAGWVYASVCPQGHANQPHAGNCRVCGQPLPSGDPVAAPQPLLGKLRFSTGELVDLDRRVIIGRAPSVSRVSSSELPRLVTVPSPHQDISRSHVEVRIEDWHLVVADLHSTNGTVLRAPDRPEQLLHPGQEMVVETGWTIDLGDGVTVAIEAAG